MIWESGAAAPYSEGSAKTHEVAKCLVSADPVGWPPFSGAVALRAHGRHLSVPLMLGATVASLQVPRDPGAAAARVAGAAAAYSRGGSGWPHTMVTCRPPLVRAPYLSRMEATYEGSVRCTRSLCTCPLRPPAFDFICVFAGQVYRNARVCYVAVASRRVASIPLPSTSARVRVVGGICHRTPPLVSRITPSWQAPSRGWYLG